MKQRIWMFGLAFLLLSTLSLQADESRESRKPHPFAPSLPELTDEEEAEFDKIIDLFIAADIGGLKGEEAKKALEAFNRLPPQAVFALIRGMNRAAAIESSCPAVIIGKKIGTIIRSSTDAQLLDFVRENAGLGVKQSRHMGVIKDLRVACVLRKGQVERLLAANPKMVAKTTGDDSSRWLVIKPSGGVKSSPGELGKKSLADLASAAELNRGTKLRPILIEMSKREGDEVLGTLAQSAVSYEKDIRKLAGDLLVDYLARQDSKFLKKKLTDDRSQVRVATAKAVARKGLRLGDELIELLKDSEADVRQAAREALVKLAKETDYGPAADASEADRAAAIKKWQAWWAKQARK